MFKVPKIVRRIIRLQRIFLWGWGKEEKKMTWIKWDVLCKEKEKWGLGIKDIERFNLALIAKWKWRLGVEK